MKKTPLFLLFFAAALAFGSEPAPAVSDPSGAKNPAVDSVEATVQRVDWIASNTSGPRPDRVRISMHVRYDLVDLNEGTVAVAVNDKAEMDFSTLSRTPVARGKGELNLFAEVTMFERDALRCMVVLTRPGAGPAEKPLAVAYVSVDQKQLRAAHALR